MKLNELRRRLAAKDYKYEIKDDFLIVYSKEKWKTKDRYKMAASVSLIEVNHMRTYVDDEFLLDLFYQFSTTPLFEREEEKEDKVYYIRISELVMNFVNFNNVCVGFNPIALATSSFTPAQIDNFPPEIKGALECGFLRKDEKVWR